MFYTIVLCLQFFRAVKFKLLKPHHLVATSFQSIMEEWNHKQNAKTTNQANARHNCMKQFCVKNKLFQQKSIRSVSYYVQFQILEY